MIENQHEAYESAMRVMDDYIHREKDGTFNLSRLSSPTALGIDPVIFADLYRSIQETNKKILSGDIDPREIE